MTKPLCIYHGNCADGFGAAWVVRQFFNGEVDFHPGFYGAPPPDVGGRDVVLVDFSYKRLEINRMISRDGGARSVLVLDHHKTAEQELAGFRPPAPTWSEHQNSIYRDCVENIPEPSVYALFDMNRSGAGLTWDYFFPNDPRPRLIDHVEDRDLWRFSLPGSADLHVAVMSYPLDFSWWDAWAGWDARGLDGLRTEGMAINRKLKQDIAHLLGVATRRMVIGGVEVPVANLPYMMASEAAGLMAETAPFAATYYDGADGRHFSLRSRGEDGMDVAEIAKRYGGGGHRNAAGFKMAIGWEGDQ